MIKLIDKTGKLVAIIDEWDEVPQFIDEPEKPLAEEEDKEEEEKEEDAEK